MFNIFNAKSVAIIGASRDPKKLGHVVLENMLHGYKGATYPINPEASFILGKKCYQSILSTDDKIDLAVVMTPAKTVPGIIGECARKGVKTAIILSVGFGEIGNHKSEGLIMKAKKKMRILGPNCIGVYDSYSKIDTIFTTPQRQGRPGHGGISFISQSGAFGAILMDLLASEGIGLAKFISIGNRIDIDESEALEYLRNDNETKTIALYIEGVKNGRNFFNVLKKTAKQKPVIVMKAGRTGAGIEAVSSHTGTLAGHSKIFSAVFKQSHAIEATKIEDLGDFSKIFASQPFPKGKRVQIITNGGGLGILCIDELEKKQLKIAKLAEKTIKHIEKNVPAYVSVSNPMDLSGDATTERFELAIETCLKDKNTDALVIAILLQISAVQSNIVDVIINAKKHKKPIVVCSIGGDFTTKHKKLLEQHDIPTYPTPQRAIKSLQALMKYAEYKGVIK
ncbi:MAG: CoA-binding protein [Candidatus Aenigmarchaeota archaeon]|nr:CoA-binding protein [Candidatus Aenigmarchaeota archaeon]